MLEQNMLPEEAEETEEAEVQEVPEVQREIPEEVPEEVQEEIPEEVQQLSSAQLRDLRQRARRMSNKIAVDSEVSAPQREVPGPAEENLIPPQEPQEPQEPQPEVQTESVRDMSPEYIARVAAEAAQKQSRVRQKVQSQQPLPINKDIENLIYVGAVEEEFEVAGYAFRMHTLTGEESTETWASIAAFEGISAITKLYIETLARAIDTINGQSLDELYRGRDIKTLSRTEKRVKVVSSWQNSLIARLFEVYSSLAERGRSAFEEVQEKN